MPTKTMTLKEAAAKRPMTRNELMRCVRKAKRIYAFVRIMEGSHAWMQVVKEDVKAQLRGPKPFGYDIPKKDCVFLARYDEQTDYLYLDAH
jgi:hypothetical protein